jgi:hypothetical protein
MVNPRVWWFTTAPAGADSTVREACIAASARGITPPLDCMITGSGRPAACARVPSAAR